MGLAGNLRERELRLIDYLAQEIEMSETFKRGDEVSWKSHGGTARGKIVRKVTEPMTIKGHKVAASQDDPQFLVETEEGKRAAHKPSALSKD